MAATKNTKKTNGVKTSRGNGRRFFTDERMKLVTGFIISCFGIFLFISSVSYLFTWKADQSFEWSRVFSDPEYTVENSAGKAGAYLSNLLMNKWFGIASFAIPFVLVIAGLKLMKVRIKRLFRTTGIALTAMILLSVWAGFVLRDTGGFLGSGAGGRHGLYMGSWLSSFAGTIGAALILLTITLIFLLIIDHSFITKLGAMIPSGRGNAAGTPGKSPAASSKTEKK
jgi:S-DNA-T family DNA segregation ATPase FtsK/SpoIIIE